MTATKNKSSKILLGKLLANEDISMVYCPVTRVPNFDVLGRTLTLPAWASMENDVEDLMIGHEVAHALYTPTEKWMNIAKEDRIFSRYVNLVEDARIERFIKNKYPGLRLPMRKGYENLFKRGFFGVESREDISALSIADRVNLHFKLGTLMSFDFTGDQKKVVDLISAATTFDQVVSAAKLLMVMDQKEKDKKEDPDDTTETYDFDTLFSIIFSPNAGGNQEQIEKYLQRKSQDQMIRENLAEASCKGKPANRVAVITDSVFDVMYDQYRSFESRMGMGSITFARIPRLSYEEYTVPSRVIFDMAKASLRLPDSEYIYLYSQFLRDHKNQIDHLLKEFELKKAAHAFDKQRIHKTGDLNVDKLWRYPFSEDLFLNTTVVPNAKNHGMLMVIDFSGSMQKIIKETIEQAISLAIFCRRANIPFEMYTLNNNRFYSKERQVMNMYGPREVTPNKDDVYIRDQDFRLQQLLHSGMNNTEFRQCIGVLCAVSRSYNSSTNTYVMSTDSQRYTSLETPSHLLLGQTPLQETALCLFSLTERFQQLYSPEVMNTIILTDGDPTGQIAVSDSPYASRNTSIKANYNPFGVHYHGPESFGTLQSNKTLSSSGHTVYEYGPTRQRFDFRKRTRDCDSLVFYALIELYRQVTGANTIGYFLVPDEPNSDIRRHPLTGAVSKFSVRASVENAPVLVKDCSLDHKFVTMDILGFNTFFACLTSTVDSEENPFPSNSKRRVKKKTKPTTLSGEEVKDFTRLRFQKKAKKMFVTNFMAEIVKQHT